MRVWLHPEAFRELGEAAAFYEHHESGHGERFLAAVASALRGIQDAPDRWPVFDGRVRRRLVNVYPYGVLYHSDGRTLSILAIMHTHRDPVSWRARMPSGPGYEEP